MKIDITMIDIRMNTNLDKWYKIAKTRVINEKTAKKLMRENLKKFKKKTKNSKKNLKNSS
jgi:hypothetical protein